LKQWKTGPFVLCVLAATLSLTSCLGGWWKTRSSDAEVLSFAAIGQVGSALIDSAALSISITLEPMDAAAAAVSMTISEGAAGDAPVLVDGTPLPFTLTAEDGTERIWTVTATVQYGTAFTVNGIKRVLTEGYSDIPEHLPIISIRNGSYTAFYAFEIPTESSAIMPTGSDTLMIYFIDLPPFDGDFDVSQPSFAYYESYDTANPPVLGNPWFYAGPSSLGTTITVLGISGGTDHGSIVRGSFSGTVERWNNDDPSGEFFTLSGGYFKASYYAAP
jgi:hypothetical protein